MTKERRIERIKELLNNEYGVFGREKPDLHTINFSDSAIKKMGLEHGEGKTIMYEAYLSDSTSGVLVNNKFGDSIDIKELTAMEVFLIGRMIEWKRNRNYMYLC